MCACKNDALAEMGVENVHTLCAGKLESDDRGNNMIAGPSGRTV